MKRMIVSGYFNPLHVGHLEMMENGRKRADYLIVIVNNDAQQMLKKGQIILKEDDRVRVVKALRVVDEVVLSIDDDPSVSKTLEMLAKRYADDELIFGNGGDRTSGKVVPETGVCERYNIPMQFDLAAQLDSSTRITSAMTKL